jgi:4'-phosphopantetheinyl transferase EntD
MFEEILPANVAVADAFTDPPDLMLYPEEEALVARAVPGRRLEFTTARWCARSALSQLGLPPEPILTGERGVPVWPRGVVGSLTHCTGYRAAALARAREFASLGIDAEPHGVLPDGVCDIIARPEEMDALAELTTAVPGVHWDRLLFSAKESVYKAWFPLTGLWLGFEDASVTIDPAHGRFTVRLVTPEPMTALAGRWVVRHGLILTSIVVHPDDTRSADPR